jgi:hypothetical protein
MPLIKSRSKKAFSKNVETEMSAGKPQNQSLAIAYSVKRKAKKKASGGTVESGSRDMNMADGGSVSSGKTRWQNEKGVHSESGSYDKPGKSDSGVYIRSHGSSSDKSKGLLKREHEDIMGQQRQIKPKLQGLAEGGSVSAKTEKRPMPNDSHNDSDETRRNKGNKAPGQDSWTDNVTIKQAQKPSITKLSQPKMVGSDVFSVRNRDMHADEADLQGRIPPESDLAQPVSRDDEQDAKKMGKGPDMAAQHDNGKPPYNKAIEDQYAQDMAAAQMKKTQSYAAGGPVMQPKDHGDELMEREDEAHLMDTESPSEDEGDADATSRDEEDQNKSGTPPHKMKMMAEGGELENDRADSIAAAIMAKRDRLHAEIDSGAHDMDTAVRMADGGEIHSKGSWDTHEDADQADLSRNADEDANEEDQMSFGALRKENYSETPGLDELDSPEDSGEHGDSEESDSEDKHDMISTIRSKMNQRRQFKVR